MRIRAGTSCTPRPKSSTRPGSGNCAPWRTSPSSSSPSTPSGSGGGSAGDGSTTGSRWCRSTRTIRTTSSAWELSADATETRLVEDLRRLASHVGEAWFHQLKVGVILAKAHAYEPLLYAGKGCEVTIRPVPLDENEKKVVEGLAGLGRER